MNWILKRIEFKRLDLGFLGRNGFFNCVAIDVHAAPGVISIEPVTSKRNVGLCIIQIDPNKAEEICKVIMECAEQARDAKQFIWKSKSGGRPSNNFSLNNILLMENNVNDYDTKLHDWAKECEIGDVWEDEDDVFTRVN
jgi:hypothetical protein